MADMFAIQGFYGSAARPSLLMSVYDSVASAREMAQWLSGDSLLTPVEFQVIAIPAAWRVTCFASRSEGTRYTTEAQAVSIAQHFEYQKGWACHVVREVESVA